MLLFLMAQLLVKGQIEEFAPVGAEWKYVEFLEYFKTYRSERDTIIENKNCRIVSKSNNNLEFIFYQDSLKIYELIDNEFELIFDFGKEVGDTVRDYVITQIDTIEINGKSFPRQLVECVEEGLMITEYSSLTILFPIGHTGGSGFNSLQKIGDSLELFIIDPLLFLCYSNSVDEYPFSNQFFDCDFNFLYVENIKQENLISFDYNTQTINISEPDKLHQLEIFSIDGILSKRFKGQILDRINFNETGFWIIRGINNDNQIETLKIIIYN